MRRRALILGIAAAAVSTNARAQQQRTPVIGYLGSETRDRFATRLEAFRRGLATTGFHEGQNVSIEYRWAEGHNDRLPALAADLVQQEVSVIAAPGNVTSGLAAKAATASIPVVFETGADPIAAGLVSSIQRPGGNVTEVTSLNTEVGPKRLELLHTIMPAATTFALLVNPTNRRNTEGVTRGLQSAARALGRTLHILEASTEQDFARAFEAFSRSGAGGLVISNEIFFSTRYEQLAALAVSHSVPAIHQSREFAVAGGLASYGGNVREFHTQAGIYTGRILKGEKPADLPIQHVTTLEMTINLKAARALGLSIDAALLARADEVIE